MVALNINASTMPSFPSIQPAYKSGIPTSMPTKCQKCGVYCPSNLRYTLSSDILLNALPLMTSTRRSRVRSLPSVSLTFEGEDHPSDPRSTLSSSFLLKTDHLAMSSRRGGVSSLLRVPVTFQIPPLPLKFQQLGEASSSNRPSLSVFRLSIQHSTSDDVLARGGVCPFSSTWGYFPNIFCLLSISNLPKTSSSDTRFFAPSDSLSNTPPLAMSPRVATNAHYQAQRTCFIRPTVSEASATLLRLLLRSTLNSGLLRDYLPLMISPRCGGGSSSSIISVALSGNQDRQIGIKITHDYETH